MAGFNINQFVSQGLKDGGARPSQFNITMTPPGGIGTTASRQLEFLASAASLPASTIPDVEIPYFGRKIKINGDRVYDNWTISVMNDEDFALRSMFEAWHAAINTPISNRLDLSRTNGSLAGYKVDAEVKQYGKAGPGDEAGIIRAYKFHGLWPVSVDAIPLDWNQTNSVETFNVTFAVDLWEPSVIGRGIAYPSVLSDDGVLGS